MMASFSSSFSLLDPEPASMSRRTADASPFSAALTSSGASALDATLMSDMLDRFEEYEPRDDSRRFAASACIATTLHFRCGGFLIGATPIGGAPIGGAPWSVMMTSR